MKKTNIRRVSSRRGKELREYSKLRKKYLEENSVCEICNLNAAVHIHHVIGRQGSRLNDTKMWAALCPVCHDWVHRNPKAARESGYLKDRLTSASSHPQKLST